MRRCLLSLAFFLSFSTPLLAQHGTARNGYYPEGYQGDTWTGVVTSVNPQSFAITLEYKKGKNTETFIGTPEKGYLVHEHNGQTRPLQPTDIRVGQRITVWYNPETKKINGRKVKMNTIILIDIAANARPGRSQFMTFEM
jgi:hypothetical protein